MNFSCFARAATLVGLAGVSALLAGCYVVPLQPPQPASVQFVPAPPMPVTFSARLYPANDMAAAYGTVMAVVTNDLNGRGHFSTNINGESFSGEATRVAGSREGVANGAGNRGGFLNCRYTMNSTTLGTGTCEHSNGARFTMHVGG
ncbi:MAG: hypothetical protein V4787_00010 [Pseudomonadota bacterium]